MIDHQSHALCQLQTESTDIGIEPAYLEAEALDYGIEPAGSEVELAAFRLELTRVEV